MYFYFTQGRYERDFLWIILLNRDRECRTHDCTYVCVEKKLTAATIFFFLPKRSFHMKRCVIEKWLFTHPTNKFKYVCIEDHSLLNWCMCEKKSNEKWWQILLPYPWHYFNQKHSKMVFKKMIKLTSLTTAMYRWNFKI